MWKTSKGLPAGRQGFTLKRGANEGFTLIEFMVVMALAAIFTGVAALNVVGSQKKGRDGRRKTDLETIRTALELRRNDSGSYPPTGSLGILVPNYISALPTDPLPGRVYYYSSAGTTYQLCSALEVVPSLVQPCGGATSCGVACNYRTINP